MVASAAHLGLEAIRLTASILYIVVAALVLRRHVDKDARLARLGFAGWWFGLAFLGFLSAPVALGWDILERGIVAWRVFMYLIFCTVFLALAGLVYYLVYLYTGRRAAWRPVAAFYAAMLAYLVFLVEGFGPYIGVEEGTLAILFETEQPPLAILAFSLGLSLPPLAATIAYLALYFRMDDRESRYRILLVSVGLGGWFLYSVTGTVFRFITETEKTYASTLVAQIVGFAAACMILVAFAPPRPVRRWITADGGTPA